MDGAFFVILVQNSTFESPPETTSMSYACLHLDAKTTIARTSIRAWNALMRADPIFGRYALSEMGRSTFLAAFTIVENGAWRVGGKLHRVATPDIPGSGGPALVCDHYEDWFERGKRHRVGGPAVIYAFGGEEWWEHGELHRTDGPAVTRANGSEEWYARGQRHRIGEQPARTHMDGSMEWFERGNRHRIGGPAVICVGGGEDWYEHGQLHRIGGPARTYSNGAEEWYEHGVRRSSPGDK